MCLPLTFFHQRLEVSPEKHVNSRCIFFLYLLTPQLTLRQQHGLRLRRPRTGLCPLLHHRLPRLLPLQIRQSKLLAPAAPHPTPPRTQSLAPRRRRPRQRPHPGLHIPSNLQRDVISAGHEARQIGDLVFRLDIAQAYVPGSLLPGGARGRLFHRGLWGFGTLLGRR
jgi:hypothetical protein